MLSPVTVPEGVRDETDYIVFEKQIIEMEKHCEV